MADPPSGKRETILVVDDAEVIVDVVVAMLNAADFHVLRAHSGLDALKVAADYQGKIDLLLCDVRMPEMSGPELGEALKLARPDTHVMFMSAFSGADRLALNYAWAFIRKPFTQVKLLEMIHSILHAPDTGSERASCSTPPCAAGQGAAGMGDEA